MRATAQNAVAATYVGIDTRRIYAIIWAISAAVAALAGVLLAPMLFVHVDMGIVGLNALPAAIIGGIDSFPGAVVGGIIAGEILSLTAMVNPQYSDVMLFAAMALVLIFRPQGLMGQEGRE